MKRIAALALLAVVINSKAEEMIVSDVMTIRDYELMKSAREMSQKEWNEIEKHFNKKSVTTVQNCPGTKNVAAQNLKDCKRTIKMLKEQGIEVE
ncbi:hypothetical protein [Pseudomonas tohonis]|uniref:hypothetical protein n=1 Tax=Pseudomonas tohonis TaxID=2725477 RepID=UPI001F1C9442|nr:hypothetical protein [Pseudomonas tohonis]